MRDGGINANHEIHLFYQRSGVREVVQLAVVGPDLLKSR